MLLRKYCRLFFDLNIYGTSLLIRKTLIPYVHTIHFDYSILNKYMVGNTIIK